MIRKIKTSPFVFKRIEMLRDNGYKKLSSNAKILWEYLRAEYNPRKSVINPATGKIQVYLPYEKMKDINGFSSPKSMSRAIKELIQADFIEKAEQGGLMRGMSAYYFVGQWASFQPRVTRQKNGNRK